MVRTAAKTAAAAVLNRMNDNSHGEQSLQLRPMQQYLHDIVQTAAIEQSRLELHVGRQYATAVVISVLCPLQPHQFLLPPSRSS